MRLRTRSTSLGTLPPAPFLFMFLILFFPLALPGSRRFAFFTRSLCFAFLIATAASSVSATGGGAAADGGGGDSAGVGGDATGAGIGGGGEGG